MQFNLCTFNLFIIIMMVKFLSLKNRSSRGILYNGMMTFIDN